MSGLKEQAASVAAQALALAIEQSGGEIDQEENHSYLRGHLMMAEHLRFGQLRCI